MIHSRIANALVLLLGVCLTAVALATGLAGVIAARAGSSLDPSGALFGVTCLGLGLWASLGAVSNLRRLNTHAREPRSAGLLLMRSYILVMSVALVLAVVSSFIATRPSSGPLPERVSLICAGFFFYGLLASPIALYVYSRR